MHDVIIVGIPLIAILAGILFNNGSATVLRSEMKDVRSEMKDVRSEMKDFRSEMKADMRELRSEMRTRFDLVDAELRYFHGTVGKLDARMDAIEKRS
jgi:Sec-independent protein translocase protein TatA